MRKPVSAQNSSQRNVVPSPWVESDAEVGFTIGCHIVGHTCLGLFGCQPAELAACGPLQSSFGVCQQTLYGVASLKYNLEDPADKTS